MVDGRTKEPRGSTGIQYQYNCTFKQVVEVVHTFVQEQHGSYCSLSLLHAPSRRRKFHAQARKAQNTISRTTTSLFPHLQSNRDRSYALLTSPLASGIEPLACRTILLSRGFWINIFRFVRFNQRYGRCSLSFFRFGLEMFGFCRKRISFMSRVAALDFGLTTTHRRTV